MNKKLNGILLLWIGFLSGSLATVWNAPNKGVEFAGSLRTIDQATPLLGRRVVLSAVVPARFVIAGADFKSEDKGKPEDQKSNEKSGKESEKEDSLSKEDKLVEKLKIVEGFTPVVFEYEPKPDGWQLINWSWYGVSVALGVVGIVLIRIGVSEGTRKSDKTEASLSEIKASLNRLVMNVQQLAKDSKQLPPSQILERIDNDLTEDFLAFADGRESIAVEHGLAVFADVMSSFASGERAVNRAWSAAADGYVNESEDCLERASEMLREAYALLEAS